MHVSPDQFVTLSQYFLALVSLYITLFIIPLETLKLQNYLTTPHTHTAAVQEEKKNLQRNKLSLSVLVDYSLSWPRVLLYIIPYIIVVSIWITLVVIVLVPSRLGRPSAFSRSCEVSASSVVMLTLSLICMPVFILIRSISRFGRNRSDPEKYKFQNLSYELKALWFLLLLPGLPYYIVTTICCDSVLLGVCKDVTDFINFPKRDKLLPARLILCVLLTPFLLANVLFRTGFQLAQAFCYISMVQWLVSAWCYSLATIASWMSKMMQRHQNAKSEMMQGRPNAGRKMSKNTEMMLHIVTLLSAFAYVPSLCFVWVTWVVTFDTLSFIIFTALGFFLIETVQTVFVVAAIVGLAIAFLKEFKAIDGALVYLHNTGLGLADSEAKAGKVESDMKTAGHFLMEQVNQTLQGNHTSHDETPVERAGIVVGSIHQKVVYQQFLMNSALSYWPHRTYQEWEQRKKRIRQQVKELTSIRTRDKKDVRCKLWLLVTWLFRKPFSDFRGVKAAKRSDSIPMQSNASTPTQSNVSRAQSDTPTQSNDASATTALSGDGKL